MGFIDMYGHRYGKHTHIVCLSTCLLLLSPASSIFILALARLPRLIYNVNVASFQQLSEQGDKIGRCANIHISPGSRNEQRQHYLAAKWMRHQCAL